jgi:hypothetical protein
MPAITRPAKAFSFADYAKNNPRGALPGDRLDAQIQNLIDAIHSTQMALADIRRDDGKLKNASVGADQLATELRHTRGELDEIDRRIIEKANQVIGTAVAVQAVEKNVDLRALDAENAAMSAAQFLSAVNTAKDMVDQRADQVATATDGSDTWATDAENWANSSQAYATNSQTSEQQSAAWAEYLAGPVVDSNAAPAYIAGTPWGHGLYYQPVEGYGGMAGLWSAKWWAIYAAQLTGSWSFYYLGAWAYPPAPGSANPATGVKVPNPLAPGSFYYDTTSGQLYVWNGGAWVSPFVLSPGYLVNYVYVAVDGQSVFSGPDNHGITPVVGTSSSDVHLNGVRLVAMTDYTVDASSSTLTLASPVGVNSIVQWDLLLAPDTLSPGAVHALKCTVAPAPDGTTTAFSLTYPNPSTGTQPTVVAGSAELQVSVDGVVQEPGVNFNASGATLTMATAPPAGSHFWVVWFANATLTGG